MRWFDSDFDYVQELIDTWNRRRKKLRTTYFIIAAILLIAGILTAIFPIRIFSFMQYLAAVSAGRYDFLSIFSSDRNNRFNLIPGEGRNIVYLNGEELFSPMPLKAYDLIDFGQTKLLFVPLCGEQFRWEDKEGDRHGSAT